MRVVTIYLTLLITALCSVDSVKAQQHAERQLVRSGNEAFNNKEYSQSLELYNEALEVAPECYEALYNRANAYHHVMRDANSQDSTKSWEQSNLYYEEMANNTRYSKEQRAEALRNVGESLMAQQNYEAALNAFRESLLLNPNDQETKHNYVLAKRIVDQKREQQQQQQQGGGDNNQNNDQNQDEQQQQQEQQQSGGGNNDQNQDQNQDQNDDQKGNQKGDQNKDGDNQQNNDDSGEDKQESGNGDGQERSDDNQQQEQPQGGSGNEDSDTEQPDGQANTPQPTGLSQEQERLLDAIQGEEDKTQEKLGEKRKGVYIPGKKNW